MVLILPYLLSKVLETRLNKAINWDQNCVSGRFSGIILIRDFLEICKGLNAGIITRLSNSKRGLRYLGVFLGDQAVG